MNYILFDGTNRNNLLPLTFTRPVADIRIGILTIREKWEKFLETNLSVMTQDYLEKKHQPGFSIDDDNLFIYGGLCPNTKLLEELNALKPGNALYEGDTLLALNTGSLSFENALSTAKRFESHAKALTIINLWDIFTKNGDAITNDYTLLTKGRNSLALSKTNQLINPENIFVEEGAKIECAILNASAGPIYIGKDAEIMEGSIVRGPFALCEHSALKLGAKIYGPTTIGPHSKVGGEVNNSVFLGYSNKAHDGFIGNSVIGEWCNIGADSNNSNLKNNYANVKLWNYAKEKFVDTGLQFCGLIMGDHSKCGINTMFNTGTVVGINANIFGSGFPRNFIPSFSWGGAAGFTNYKLNDAFDVAEKVMERRGLKLDTTDKEILSHIFNETEKFRK